MCQKTKFNFYSTQKKIKIIFWALFFKFYVMVIYFYYRVGTKVQPSVKKKIKILY